VTPPPPDGHPDPDEPDEPERRQTLGEAAGKLGLAMAAVLVIGLTGGYLFARTSPQRAASTVLSGVVVEEDVVGDARRPADTDDPAPSSGDHVGEPQCGVAADPVDADTQLASLAAGIVVVQHGPDATATDVERLTAFAATYPDAVLVAPNPALDAPVVVTGWGRRLVLDQAVTSLVNDFVTAYGGVGPRPADCTVRTG
jgi:hypothetical protein